MKTQSKTTLDGGYGTSRKLRAGINLLVNKEIEVEHLRQLTTELHFSVQEERPVLSEATDELIMIMCSATFRDELRDDQRAVVAHAAELTQLVAECMQDNGDVSIREVIRYAEKLDSKRKKVGLIQYEDICGR